MQTLTHPWLAMPAVPADCDLALTVARYEQGDRTAAVTRPLKALGLTHIAYNDTLPNALLHGLLAVTFPGPQVRIAPAAGHFDIRPFRALLAFIASTPGLTPREFEVFAVTVTDHRRLAASRQALFKLRGGDVGRYRGEPVAYAAKLDAELHRRLGEAIATPAQQARLHHDACVLLQLLEATNLVRRQDGVIAVWRHRFETLVDIAEQVPLAATATPEFKLVGDDYGFAIKLLGELEIGEDSSTFFRQRLESLYRTWREPRSGLAPADMVPYDRECAENLAATSARHHQYYQANKQNIFNTLL